MPASDGSGRPVCGSCGGCRAVPRRVGEGEFATELCKDCAGELLPTPPDGWQYAVIRDDLQIWGCGDGEGGRIRQRMRLRYRNIVAPCLAPMRWENP